MTAILPTRDQRNFWYVDNDADLALVYLHGFLSNSRDCWLRKATKKGQPQVYWPSLAATDSSLGAPAIYLAGYETSPLSHRYNIRNCADEVWTGFQQRRGNQRSVLDRHQLVLVCHSTGGVVARYLLYHHREELANKAIYLLLLASPTHGSWLANWGYRLAGILRQSQLRDLQAVSPFLDELHDNFGQLVHDKVLPNLNGLELYESPHLLSLTVVPKRSLGGYFGRVHAAPGEDHSGISKPTGRNHPTHRHLVGAVAAVRPMAPLPEAPYSALEGYADVVDVLRNRFGFAWERSLCPSCSPLPDS